MKVYLMRVEYGNARRRWAACSEGTKSNPGRFLLGSDRSTKENILTKFKGDTGNDINMLVTLSGLYTPSEASVEAASITHGGE